MDASPSSLLHVESDLALGHLFGLAARKWREARYLGLATAGAEALRRCHEETPDVIILDVQLPDMDGFELIAALQRLARPPRLIVLTACVTPLALMHLAARPVVGLVSKLSGEPDTLRAAFREVVAGRVFFAPDVRERFTAFRRSGTAFHKILSDRELDLLPLFGAGLDDLQVGERCGISAGTAKRHRATVLAKLGLHSTPALMRWAAQAGFVSYADGALRLHRARPEGEAATSMSVAAALPAGGRLRIFRTAADDFSPPDRAAARRWFDPPELATFPDPRSAPSGSWPRESEHEEQ